MGEESQDIFFEISSQQIHSFLYWHLVKSSTTSKLTFILQGLTWRKPKTWTDLIEFFTWCGELPVGAK
jgi:hypothetical protein